MNAVRFPYYFRFALLSYISVQRRLNICNEDCLDRKNTYELEGISRTYEDQAAMLVAEKILCASRK
jgi:hypothetical protein